MSIFLTPFARTRLFPRTPRPNTIRDCTPEQFEQLRQAAQAHSPNAMSLATAVPVSGSLELA